MYSTKDYYKRLVFQILILTALLLTFTSISLGAEKNFTFAETNYFEKLNSLMLSTSADFNFQSNSPNNNQNFLLTSPTSIFVVNQNGDTNDLDLNDGICLDSAGNCTLRAAIQQANYAPGSDEIIFDLTFPATINIDENIVSGGLTITQALKITGAGARLLTVAGAFPNTANGLFIVNSSSASNVEISGLALKNSGGAAIVNTGNLNLFDLKISQSQLGISNTGDLKINRTLISGNSKRGIDLGAASTTNIANTTITNNTSPDVGGGIYARNPNLTLNNVSIINNTAATNGGGIYYSNTASGVYLRNTLIAKNTAANGADVFSLYSADDAKFVTRGNNLIGKADANLGFVNGQNGDKVGTAAAPIDPLLGPLQNNGGRTDTIALLDNSPARDAGNNCVINSNCGALNPPPNFLVNDQRGTDFPRFFEAAVDIGAFESFYPVPQITGFEPETRGAGTAAFDLIVVGQKFVANSVVKWNDELRPTVFISNSKVKAQISAADVAAAGQFPVTVVNPTPGGGSSQAVQFSVVDCSFSLNPTSGTSPAAGSTINVNLTAPSGCVWTAVSNAPWITVSSASSSGNGSAQIVLTVQPNAGAARTGTVTIGGQTFTVQQENGCVFTLTPNSVNIAAAGGNGNFSVGVSDNTCQWTAVSNNSWITITSGGSGTTNGVVSFTVAANAGTSRSGTITVGGQTFTVNQAENCTFSLNPNSAAIAKAGGNGQFTLTGGGSCEWTAVSNDSWITITGGASGTGNGTISFTVAANTGPERVGTITAGGKTFTITQSNGCAYTLTPTNITAASAGGANQFTISTAQGCQWTAVSNNSWITITEGASGTGNGTVSFTVAANTGTERTGTITAGGKTFTVTQSNGCVYTITPTSATVGSSGGNSQFTISTMQACQWTAVSNASWITVTAGASGTGDGTISLTVAANTGPERTGTITAGGKTFTVTQASGCTFTINPTGTNFDSSGGNGSFNITTGNSACAWTAQTADNWITIIGSNTGTGNGVISFTVAANISPQRTGTITVGGKTFTVTQDNGCSFSLSASSFSAPAAGVNGQFTVNTGSGCQWTAVSNASWITITSGTPGTGSGAVAFTVAPNIGPERVGTITAGGKTFTITQASGCTFTLTPTSVTVGSAGGTSQFTISTAQGCQWTAVSSASWITITSGTSGSGNGTVEFTVAANTAPQRVGTITAGGKTFTVTQANGCIYQINPVSTNINESGGVRTFAVTTGSSCPWTAASNDSWLTITSGASGTGDGTVSLTIEASVSGQERIGTVSAAGRTFTVNQLTTLVTNNNDDGAGSLRKAIANANTIPGNDIVRFAQTLGGVVSLTSGEILVTSNGSLEIAGPGANLLTISANNQSRHFYSDNAVLKISGLTLTQGNGVGRNSSEFNKYGGSIYQYAGSLTLEGVHVNNNKVSVPVTQGNSSLGGGIYYFGGANHLIRNSTFSFNDGQYGGGFYNQSGAVSIINSTFSKNTAGREGGAVYAVGDTFLRNVTMTRNSVAATGNVGGGIHNVGGMLDFGNSIIAGNSPSEITFVAGQFTSSGYNLIGDDPGDATNTQNIVQYRPTDILDQPPLLGIVSYFGGSTPTAPLMTGSVAIDAGNNFNVSGTDQRGAARVSGNNIDIGAFEYNIKILPSPGVITPAQVDVYYYQQITASISDGRSPYETFEYFVADGFLPPGMTLTQDTGLVSGSSPTAGLYSFAIKAVASNGMAGISSYTLAIGCTYSISPAIQSFNSPGGVGSINVSTNSGCSWTAATSAAWITINEGANRSGNGSLAFSVAANTGNARSASITVADKTFTVNQAARVAHRFDFDGDSKDDYAVFRPENGAWYIQASQTGFRGIGFGQDGDIIAPADFNGDRKADIAVFRQGYWYILSSFNNVFRAENFGQNGDIPVPGDFDGDGKADISVFRPANGAWYRLNSSNGSFSGVSFGQNGDKPLIADFDGDAKSDIAVFRPSAGAFYSLNSTNGAFRGIAFGFGTDIPTMADFDGDGKTDVAVFRPSNGAWYRYNSSDGTFFGSLFGQNGDIPVAADYDGDGKADKAVYRNGIWYIDRSTSGFSAFSFGTNTDKPIPSFLN